MKSDYAGTDAISDDDAGHAYVEQFGLETFQRAENAMKANKATRYVCFLREDKEVSDSEELQRQTADTFQAAATFLDLGQIWGPLDPEISSKIKFAKYHALRIAKAIKAGEDPNLSNPVPEPSPITEPPLDQNDPEVQMINGDGPQNTDQQPSVEDVPDEGERSHHPPATDSNWIQPSHPPSDPYQAPSPPEAGEDFYIKDSGKPPDVSPIDVSSNDPWSSLGGGYFPTVPDTIGQSSSSVPVVPPAQPTPPPAQQFAHQPHFQPAAASPAFTDPSAQPNTSSLHSFPPPTMSPPANGAAPTALVSPPAMGPPAHSSTTPHVPTPGPHFPSAPGFPQQRAPVPAPAPAPVYQPPPAAPVPSVAPPSNNIDFRTDEESVLAAQKHARFAISALNFEDVKTAVKELKGALESLGAG